MDKKVTGIVAYITLIGWAIAYFVGDREGAKFHLNQALVLGLAQLLLSIIPLVGWILSLVLFVLWVIAFVAAIQGKEKAVPLLGGIVLLK